MYTKQLRMNVSGSTNREFQISKSFQFMFSLFKIKRSGSCGDKTAEMNVSGSTNRELRVSKSFEFMFRLFEIKRSGSSVYKTAENECFWIH